jgi:hypothetical protein
MRRIGYTFGSALALLIGAPFGPSGLAVAQTPAEPGAKPEGALECPVIDDDGQTAIAVVRYLADDALGGRLAGSEGERCAAAYIVNRFEQLGLKPAGENDTYFQEVPLASATNPHAPAGTGRNIVALLPGTDPELADEIVVIGAHYDHLGDGGFGSLGDQGEIHNGADDNASGVAALLVAAERLTSGAAPARPVLFIAFTGEESGLIGSGFYAKNPTISLEGAQAMVNLDMVGRLESSPLIVYGIGTAPEWQELVDLANEPVGIELAYEDAGYGPSDHTSFYAQDIPVLHLFTNVHGDYHKPSDDWDKIDADGLERVGGFAARIVASVADRPDRLTLVPGIGAPAQDSGGYGAYLGTVPDFTPVDHGVLLSGVSAGSPAEAAGIEGGDTIIALGEHDVADLYALTDALRAHAPGDRVRVVVIREGEEVEFEVVLGDRSDR